MSDVAEPQFQTKAKYEQVFEYLKNQIENEHKPGYKIPPETVLAKQLGINKSTVSKALVFLEKEGYVSRKQGVGTIVCFQRKPVISNIVTGLPFMDTNLIRDTYFSVLIQQITNETIKNNVIHSVVSIGKDRKKKIDFSTLEHLAVQKSISGMIIAGARDFEIDNIAAFCEKTAFPIVWLGIRTTNKKVNYIDTDNVKSTKQLIDFARKRGLQNIYFISKTIDTFDRQERYNVFLKKFDSGHIFVCDGSANAFEAGYVEMKQILNSHTLPDCILAADRGNLDGIKKAIQEKRKGKDIPILTYDYYFDQDNHNVIASAIQPIGQIAKEAVEFVTTGRHRTPFHKILKMRIITREKDNGLGR